MRRRHCRRYEPIRTVALLVAVAALLAIHGAGLLYAADSEALKKDAATAAEAQEGGYLPPPNYAHDAPPEQPLPFSHALHAGKLRLTCATCHTGGIEPASPDAAPDSGERMSFPATDTCMRCHQAVARDKPAIRQLAEFHNSHTPVPWQRVYRVLPGVAWSHAPHLAAGVSCQNCHGAVETMPVMSMATSVTAMASCLTCHRAHNAPSTCDTCHLWPREEHFKQWDAAAKAHDER